jgi:hypothetical protein
MVSKKKLDIVKELILAKKLLQYSEKLIKEKNLDSNIIAVHNLNSALNIVLSLFSTQHKINSTKQLNSKNLEEQWAILSQEYKTRFGQDLSMKTQIFTLNNIITDLIEYDKYPSNNQVIELTQALSIFIEDFVSKVFQLSFQDLDFHILIEHPQVRNTIKEARDALYSEDFSKVLRLASASFQLAIEDQRQKINYLSDQGLLKPELLMLDKSINININPSEEDFIHLILRTPQKELQRFKQLVPTALISLNEKNKAEVVVSDYVDDRKISKENAEFCYNFVLETVLNWENLNLLIKD